LFFETLSTSPTNFIHKPKKANLSGFFFANLSGLILIKPEPDIKTESKDIDSAMPLVDDNQKRHFSQTIDSAIMEQVALFVAAAGAVSIFQRASTQSD
jgi:hypothetical protein